MPEGFYIWVNRWEEFQSFQTKRGKPWAPPWIRLYPRLLTDDDFVSLSEREQLLLVKLFMLFSSTRQLVPNSTSTLSKWCGQRVLKSHIESLVHAGWLTICSRTVLERRRAAFWNGSILEVEEEKEPKAVTLREDPEPIVGQTNGLRSARALQTKVAASLRTP